MVDIQVRNLTKFFVIGENLLDNLSFEIQEGERRTAPQALTLWFQTTSYPPSNIRQYIGKNLVILLYAVVEIY